MKEREALGKTNQNLLDVDPAFSWKAIALFENWPVGVNECYLLIDKAVAREHNSARGFRHIPFCSLPGTQCPYRLFT